MLRVSNFTADETLIHTGASEQKHLPGSLLPALLQSYTVGGFLSSQSSILSAFLWCSACMKYAHVVSFESFEVKSNKSQNKATKQKGNQSSPHSLKSIFTETNLE